MKLLAGVDGGATKTVAVIGRPDGTLLGAARASSSNYHNVGERRAVESIRRALLLACRDAQVSHRHLELAVMGLAGMDSPGDFAAGRRIARLVDVGKRRVVKHDSVIAVYAATLGKPGIVVNAGTGSFAAGIGPKGETIRAGGWGNIVDDEGSAYDIGKLGIRAALRTHDGREPRTAIRKLLMSGMRLRNLEDVIYDIYEKPMTVDEISAISRLVARAADGGDKIARGIFAYEGRVLANLVSAIAKRLKITSERPDIYCVGGVFRSGTILLKPFKRELRKSVPAFTLRRPRFDPVIGAFVLAMKQEGVLVSGQVVTNLKSSYARHAENVR